MWCDIPNRVLLWILNHQRTIHFLLSIGIITATVGTMVWNHTPTMQHTMVAIRVLGTRPDSLVNGLCYALALKAYFLRGDTSQNWSLGVHGIATSVHFSSASWLFWSASCPSQNLVLFVIWKYARMSTVWSLCIVADVLSWTTETSQFRRRNVADSTHFASSERLVRTVDLDQNWTHKILFALSKKVNGFVIPQSVVATPYLLLLSI